MILSYPRHLCRLRLNLPQSLSDAAQPLPLGFPPFRLKFRVQSGTVGTWVFGLGSCVREEGLYGRYPETRRGPHIITSAIEHSAEMNVCEDLEKQGCVVTYLPVYDDGLVRIADVAAAVTDETVLISVMTANNEIGTIQPVDEIGRLVRSLREGGKKIWFHTDAVQAAGKVPIDVEAMGCEEFDCL